MSAALAMSGPVAVAAGEPVVCPKDLGYCLVDVGTPGGQPSAGDPTRTKAPAKPACSIPQALLHGGDPVACTDPLYGMWDNQDGCYWQPLAPQPPATDPAWAGHYPDGAIYQTTCFGTIGIGGGWAWRADPPDGGATVTPAQLAQRAVRMLVLEGPAIGIAPSTDGAGLVGLPVWMWTRVSAATWGPTSATAAVPGLSVTATARAGRVVWDMGDGSRVTCTGPGTAFIPARGAAESPDCGHVYTRPSASQPSGRYRVTATTTWNVTWIGGGQTGALTVTRSASTSVLVHELQVVVS